MKITIIPCGETGVTHKAAEKLAKMIGDAQILSKKYKGELDEGVYILGTNIHFGKFNKRFYKFLEQISKRNLKFYIYICGAEIERKDYYIDLMRAIAPSAEDIHFVWGELDPRGTSFFKRFAINSFISGRKKDGLPLPRLLDKELKALCRSIKEQ